MQAQLSDLFTQKTGMIPVIALSIGLLGSVHCMGMCGPLAALAHSKAQNLWPYQWGRLLSYILLGAFGSLLGSIFTTQLENPYLSLIPTILMSLFFIYWGMVLKKNRALHLPLPKFITLLYAKFSHKIMRGKNFLSSFFIGFFSILLPCGLLYGVVLTMATFQNIWIGMIALFFFWCGTLPGVGFAPDFFHKILNPFFKKYPTFSGHFMMTIGVFTLGIRIYNFIASGGQSCH